MSHNQQDNQFCDRRDSSVQTRLIGLLFRWGYQIAPARQGESTMRPLCPVFTNMILKLKMNVKPSINDTQTQMPNLEQKCTSTAKYCHCHPSPTGNKENGSRWSKSKPTRNFNFEFWVKRYFQARVPKPLEYRTGKSPVFWSIWMPELARKKDGNQRASTSPLV